MASCGVGLLCLEYHPKMGFGFCGTAPITFLRPNRFEPELNLFTVVSKVRLRGRPHPAEVTTARSLMSWARVVLILLIKSRTTVLEEGVKG